MEWRGFVGCAAERYEAESAKPHIERRTDVYVVLRDLNLNLKLRGGRDLEVKERSKRDAETGAETWSKTLGRASLSKGWTPATLIEALEKERAEVFQRCARLLRDGEEGRDFWVVQIDKVRTKGMYFERAVCRITLGERVDYVESYCLEGKKPGQAGAEERELLEGCSFHGGYNVFLDHWIKNLH